MAPADDRALVPSQEQRPQFSREDLELVGGEFAVDESEGSALQTARAAVASGAYTPERAATIWGLSDAERAALARPPSSTRTPSALAAIEAELAEIAALRKSDRRLYWSQETQARESALFAKAERLKALPAAARDEAADDALPEALQDRWARQPGGVDEALGTIRRRLTMAFDGEDVEELKLAFDAGLDGHIQVEVADALATDGGRWPVANAAEISEFRETEHGKALLSEWGSRAPALLGAALAEANFIMGQLDETSRLKLHRWCAARPVEQRGQIIRVLAARAAKRSAIRASGG